MRFNYDEFSALKKDIDERGFELPLSENLDILSKKLSINGKQVHNSLAIHPMEGCDSTPDGTPDELTIRRYSRFARGGAGLLWVEACAVVHEGRANPRQIYIHERNKDEYKKLVDFIKKEAADSGHPTPYLVLQITHSGRYSRPGGGLPAVAAAKNPYLDKFLPENHKFITDEELCALEDKFASAAALAAYAGFDAVDIKSCHGYLSSELLGARTRVGEYGGNFENRTRFLLNIVDKINDSLGEKIAITTRINAYDEVPYPYGLGSDEDDPKKQNLTEICVLASILYEKGVRLINITGGNPYYNPHVNRPADNNLYESTTHQLESIYKLLNAARQVKSAVPDIRVIASGFSWLREFGANLAAGCIENGWFDLAGFGRQSIAYPDFPNDIIKHGGMVRRKCCIGCTKCTIIMRDGGRTGCAIRDHEVYMPIFNEGRRGKPEILSNRKAEHI